MEQHHSSQKGMIDNLKPKTAFKAGLLSGLVIFFVVGFFILLGMMLNDGKSGSKSNVTTNTGNNGGTVNNAPSGNNNAGAVAADINIQGLDEDNDWIRGDLDAPVTIIEFSDIDCPFCQRFHSTMQQIVDEYSGEVNWVYRHFPLTQLHPEAAQKAQAAECIGEQGGADAFWEYLDRDFAERPKLAQVSAIVSDLGLDVNEWQTCLDSGKYSEKVTNHTNQATTAGGRGTPYSVIIAGDQKIPINGALPYETVKAQLDSILN